MVARSETHRRRDFVLTEIFGGDCVPMSIPCCVHARGTTPSAIPGRVRVYGVRVGLRAGRWQYDSLRCARLPFVRPKSYRGVQQGGIRLRGIDRLPRDRDSAGKGGNSVP